jgi:hypothetical protein
LVKNVGRPPLSPSRTRIARLVAQLDYRQKGGENRVIETLSCENQQEVLLGRAMKPGASVQALADRILVRSIQRIGRTVKRQTKLKKE